MNVYNVALFTVALMVSIAARFSNKPVSNIDTVTVVLCIGFMGLIAGKGKG